MDKVLEDIFLTLRYWEGSITDGVNKKIDRHLMTMLTDPQIRGFIFSVIDSGKWVMYDSTKGQWNIVNQIPFPHQGQVPKKDSNEMRTVYILEDIDRIIAAIYNNYLFEKCGSLVHPRCKSYLKGVGTGKVVQEVVKHLNSTKNRIRAIKTDMVHYFDSCPIKEIDKVYDKIRGIHGESKLTDMYQKLHHTDKCFDMNNKLIDHFYSIGQGIAIASFFADAILYEVDDYISKNFDVYYVRFSDDILIVGNECEKAFEKLTEMLKERGLALNPKKTEYITKNTHFKFLGFAIRGNDITISKTRLKDFQKEIEKCCFAYDFLVVKNNNEMWQVYNKKKKQWQGKKYNSKKECKNALYRKRFKSALRKVIDFLYVGNGEYSWATSVLPIVNVVEDLELMNLFVLDCLRAVLTGKNEVGGLGYEPDKRKGVVTRGKGTNVSDNRLKTEKNIPGFIDLMCMRNALLSSKDVFNAMVRTMLIELQATETSDGINFRTRTCRFGNKEVEEQINFENVDVLQELQKLYDEYHFSTPSEKSSKFAKYSYFAALKTDELTDGQLILGGNRYEKQLELEKFMLSVIKIYKWEDLFNNKFFYWQGNNGLVVLKNWFEEK